jgi:hypothetical protein
MTLGNLRELGVRGLTVHCLNDACRHHTVKVERLSPAGAVTYMDFAAASLSPLRWPSWQRHKLARYDGPFVAATEPLRDGNISGSACS